MIVNQSPRTSALFRARNPDAGTEDQELLQFLAVLLVRGQQMVGNRTGVTENDLPSSWADLFEKKPQFTEADILAGIEALHKRLG